MNKKIWVYMLICLFAIMDLSAKDKNEIRNAYIEFLKSEKFRNLDYILKNEPEIKKKIESTLSIEIGENESVISDRYEAESEVHAAINPINSNNIIVSPIYSSPQTGVFRCPIYYSLDGGVTWEESSFETDGSVDNAYTAGGGDPMFTFDKNGVAYMTWIISEMLSFNDAYMGIYWAYSEDGGKTWKQNDDYTIVRGEGNVFFQQGSGDKQWMATDLSNSQYSNNVYTSLTYFPDMMDFETIDIVVYKKEAGEDSFSDDYTIVSQDDYDFVQFSNIDVGNDGNVHVTFYAQKNNKNYLYHSVSKDGAESFEPETLISQFHFRGGAMLAGDTLFKESGFSTQRYYPGPAVAVDKKNPNYVYICWTGFGIDSDNETLADVYFSRSTDGGETWETPIIVNDNQMDEKTSQFYPSIEVNEDGLVLVSYWDKRGDNNNNWADYYMSVSGNNGESFSPAIKVSAFPSNFSVINSLNNNFGIGEYNELLSTKDYAFPVWADGRSNDGNINIFIAKVALDGTGIVEELTQVNSDLFINEITPNPASEFLNISVTSKSSDIIEITIVDINGNEVIEMKDVQIADLISINIEKLLSGKYFIIADNGKSKNIKSFTVVK